jgi:cytidylate kinase
MRLVIAVDGPAGAGKGTLAKRLAAALGLPYLDTGLLYRAVGRRVLDGGGDPNNPATAETAARQLAAADLDRPDLRGPEADAAASAVAVIPGVRAALLDFQRRFGSREGAVLDGRDIGTVVFPSASAKLFLTASPAARAHRRWLELCANGVDADLAAVEQEIRIRDERDAARAVAPMRVADDAIVLDTTGLGAEAAFRVALRAVKNRLAKPDQTN